MCLTPSIAFRELKRTGIRSIICTSGTLSPMNAFEAEVGLSFKNQLCLNHVIDSEKQVYFPTL